MLLLLLACAAGSSEKDPCSTQSPTEGGIKATIDGQVWAALAQWNRAGSGIQLTSAAADGYRLTLVALQDEEGRSASESLESLPATFSLEGEGGSAAVTPDQGESAATSKGGGGSLSLSETIEDGAGRGMIGCFSFTAQSSSGTEIIVEEGTFWATELNL